MALTKPPKPDLKVNLNTSIRVITSGPQGVKSLGSAVEVVAVEQFQEELKRQAQGK